MIVLLQRVTEARVDEGSEMVGRIGHGLLVLLAVEPADDEAETERMIDRVAGCAVIPDMSGHGIRHAVREVHAGIAEPDARVCRGQQHVCASFVIARILDGSDEELRHHP